MADNFEKLNRLRVNAGKPELKSWKASQDKLLAAIKVLEDAGHIDVVPGANVEAAPVTDDPEVAANIKEEPKKPTESKGKPSLARGLDGEAYARHSRERVRDHREKEKKNEKKDKKIAGEVDAAKEPEKAKRQKDKIKAKQEARAAKPAAEKDPNQVTAAELARELDIDPKVARAKLRRYEGKDGYPKPVKGERWTFPKSAADDLRKILKGGK